MQPVGAVQVGRLRPIRPTGATWETTHDPGMKCRTGSIPAAFPAKRVPERLATLVEAGIMPEKMVPEWEITAA